MRLPACLADPISAATPRPVGYVPKFYDVIVSRKAGGAMTGLHTAEFWSYMPPVRRRCISREEFARYVQQRFRICILREFD